jgi:hypothetical protein
MNTQNQTDYIAIDISKETLQVQSETKAAVLANNEGGASNCSSGQVP